jgi:mRNA interferase RelE/StbE
LTPKHKWQVADKIQSLGDDPRPSDSKPMRGFEGYLRADSGEYRIIYRIDTCGAVLLFAILGKRNDGQVYKLFWRLNS